MFLTYPYSVLTFLLELLFKLVCLAQPVSVCICVGQTPMLHPLLHLLSQLHTGRERGLSMRVCTTHISYPIKLALSPFFLLLYEIISPY